MITITHTHEHGTILEGSSKGDGVLEIARRHGFIYRNEPGIFIRGSRDRDARRHSIDACAAALRAAGHEVETAIDNNARSAAIRRAALDERADARVESLETRAGKAYGERASRHAASDAITDGIPLGQPVQAPGHHSRAAHLNALDRSDNHMRKGIEAGEYGDTLTDRAAGTAANAAHRHDPRAIMRRIAKLETDRRGYARSIAGYVREFKRADGSVYSSDVYAPAGDERAAELRRWDARDAEEIEHLRAELAAMQTAGTFTAWTPEDFAKGDHANVGGDWYLVVRVNRKSVSVAGRFFGDGARATPVNFDEIHGRRRDGMQWDTSHDAPWPVELARQVSRWRSLYASADRAHQHPHGSDERRSGQWVGVAVRLVHGLQTDASNREVAAVLDSLDAGDGRDLAARYLAVYDRLAGGALPHEIADSIETVTGEPAWSFPTDGETVTARAGRGWPTRDGMLFVEPGDLIVGRHDRPGLGGGAASLWRAFCGPVAAVSDQINRRERGEFVTITLTDGTAETFKIGEWFEVHRAGTWETPATDEPDPAAASDGHTVWALSDNGPVMVAEVSRFDLDTPAPAGATVADPAATPAGATVTVYGVRDGQEDEMFRRERVTLDYDTDAEAQALADEIAASEPVSPGVGILVLVGRDSVNHEYATGTRAAPADAFVSGWGSIDLGAQTNG